MKLFLKRKDVCELTGWSPRAFRAAVDGEDAALKPAFVHPGRGDVYVAAPDALRLVGWDDTRIRQSFHWLRSLPATMGFAEALDRTGLSRHAFRRLVKAGAITPVRLTRCWPRYAKSQLAALAGFTA